MNMDEKIDLNRVPLGEDELIKYFRQIFTTFEVLKAIYRVQFEKGNKEAQVVYEYLEKLFYTFQVLRIKHLYSDQEKNLKLDKTDSGYPNHYDFFSLQTDLRDREGKRYAVPKQNALKREMLDFMFKHGKQPEALLPKMAERVYLDMLEKDKLFLPFNSGMLGAVGKNKKEHLYMCYWSCFNAEDNLPYVYLMTFTSTLPGGDPLHENKEALAAFRETVKSEGSRAPKLNIVASGIDTALDDVHPKILKRIRLGPFYSLNFSENLAPELKELFAHGDEHRHFALFMESEFVTSKKQIVSSSFFSKGKIREIFFVPEHQMEFYEKGISGLERSVILPYKLHQHANKLFAGYKVFSYDKKGVIHGI